MQGSGISLPLDLRHIASRCKGSFYAPKRFAVRLLLKCFPSSVCVCQKYIAFFAHRLSNWHTLLPVHEYLFSVRANQTTSLARSYTNLCFESCFQTLADSWAQVQKTQHARRIHALTVSVLTGCGGATAARLAIARAQRQLAEEADVNLHIRNFAVINRTSSVFLASCLF